MTTVWLPWLYAKECNMRNRYVLKNGNMLHILFFWYCLEQMFFYNLHTHISILKPGLKRNLYESYTRLYRIRPILRDIETLYELIF